MSRVHGNLFSAIALTMWAVTGLGSAAPNLTSSSAAQPLPGEMRLDFAATGGPAHWVRYDRYSEDAHHFCVTIDAPDAVRVEIAPRTFPIAAGAQYWVNSSLFDPRIVRAEQAGKLTLDVHDLQNTTVLIEPAIGDNLLPNSSFEERGDAIPGWVGSVLPVRQAQLEFGHELLDEEGEPLPPSAVVQGSVEISDAMARTGHYSLRLTKGTAAGSVECDARQPVAVEAGQEYLLAGYYHLDNLHFGSAMHLVVEITGPEKPPIYLRDSGLNPLIFTSPGQWRRSFVRFRVPADYSRATVRIALSQRGAPFTAYWDDFELRRAPTAVTQWPAAMREWQLEKPMTADQVRQLMKTRAPWNVKVEDDDGQPRLMVDGAPVPLFGLVGGPSNWPAGAGHADFARAGAHLHWVPLYTSQNGQYHQYGQPVWLDDGKYDWTELEKRLLEVLEDDPQAKVLLYLVILPYQAFTDRHPEAAWIDAAGHTTVGEKSDWRPASTRKPWEALNHSYTAAAFREQTDDMLRHLGQFLANDDLGKAVIGIHMVCGADGQWFAEHSPDHLDRSPGAVTAFRDWLRSRYNGQVQALQKAWGEPGVTFDTAALPEEAERSPNKYFLDPNLGADRRLIDANRFASVGTAQTINLFARDFKEGIGRPTIVTTYYNDDMHGQQVSHNALQTLLDSPALDGIVSVMEYGPWRSLGRTGSSNSLIASLRLHHKLYLGEMDYRTNYSWLPPDAQNFRSAWGVPKTTEGWKNQIRRDLGMFLAQGEGGWIYGLGGNGWAARGYMDGIGEANRAAQDVAQRPQPTDRGQIAVFVDERMQDYTSRRDLFSAALSTVSNGMARSPLSRSGLSWDAYVLSDLANPARHDYKINVFLSSVTLTPEQIEWVRNNLQKDGHVLVFINAAGYSLGDGFEKNIKALTGMNVKIDLNQAGVYHYVPYKGARLGADLGNVMTETKSPLFYVDDPSAQPLAWLEGTNKIGAAVKHFAAWTSVYLALPAGFTPGFLRELAREADITPAGPAEDATYAGNGVLSIHALTSGPKTLHWIGRSDLLDLASNQIAARGVESFTCQMQALETRWFQRLPVSH